ncbi:MAG: fumarylacetoacetate hydrolase family protein [Proteobacteria bacterium]|jgi:fumarylacetoacetate (FAA) hydrolase|nr:fumarylacetoacetate hydrolase family protein [Pseudomonadota bacterium]
MKLGSLQSSSFDGQLVVISQDLKKFTPANHIAPSLREALENWSKCEPLLTKLSEDLEAGAAKAQAIDWSKMHSAMPRTWLFADGSAFIHHIKLVRQARKAPLPETLLTVPLMYQAECGQFLRPTEDIPQRDFSHGTDFEAEVGVITDFVPMGTSPEEALKKIKLVVLINDVSLRGLIPEELAQGFGFFQSKPAKALSPVAVTLDELTEFWKEGRLHLPLHVQLNGKFFGKANAGAMHFHFGQLIAHAAKTRNLVAGTLIGSGTVANEDPSVGSSCLAEKRMIETIATGKPETSFMKVGDQVEIWMENSKGESIFGKISQTVVQHP